MIRVKGGGRRAESREKKLRAEGLELRGEGGGRRGFNLTQIR